MSRGRARVWDALLSISVWWRKMTEYSAVGNVVMRGDYLVRKWMRDATGVAYARDYAEWCNRQHALGLEDEVVINGNRNSGW